MRFEYRGLRRRASECGIDRTLKLGYRVVVVLRSFRCSIIDVSATEVDVLWRIRDLLASPLFLDKASDIFFDFATLEGQTDLFT